jgi:hypothetical protein
MRRSKLELQFPDNVERLSRLWVRLVLLGITSTNDNTSQKAVSSAAKYDSTSVIYFCSKNGGLLQNCSSNGSFISYNLPNLWTTAVISAGKPSQPYFLSHK